MKKPLTMTDSQDEPFNTLIQAIQLALKPHALRVQFTHKKGCMDTLSLSFYIDRTPKLFV